MMRGIRARGERPRRCSLRSILGVVCVLGVLAALGCHEDGKTPPPPTDTNMLRGIIRYYAAAAGELGRPPQKMEELKSILAPLTSEPDKYLRSTRDGEEFVVVWGLHLHQLPLDTIVAYERTGVDGKRFVVNLDGVVREVAADEFAKLKFPKGHTPGG